jgi:hypothetical protein
VILKKKAGCLPRLPFLFFFPLLFLSLSGCGSVTYPEARVKEALQEIALKEYKIPHIEVQFAGTTLGVFLPLRELFATDLKAALLSGKVTDMETLFQPTEEVVDKVENILFSMSRVMLSTDKKIEFYYLQATDVEKTGMDLTFIGQIDDLKRVRFWDIPRSEYRKRIIHDLQMNRAALWHRPIRHFFKDLNEGGTEDIQKAYFPKTAQAKWTREFFFADAHGVILKHGRARWSLLDVRSIPIQDNEIVVYAKAQIIPKDPADKNLRPQTLEYLFQISTTGDTEKIRRIIPLAYLDDKTANPDFTFTREMVAQSLPNWETEFKTPEITMGDFLSRQLTRRLQQLAAEDERIFNTFSSVKLAVRFEEKPDRHFIFNAVAPLKGVGQVAYSPAKGPREGALYFRLHEDVLYFWERVAREFVEVLRSYSFQDYQSLQFQIFQNGKLGTWTASREDLELFRRHKKNLASILRFSESVSDSVPDSGATGP